MNLACGKSPYFLEPFGLLSGSLSVWLYSVRMSGFKKQNSPFRRHSICICSPFASWNRAGVGSLVFVWLAHLATRFCVSTVPRSLFYASFCCQGQQSGSLWKATFSLFVSFLSFIVSPTPLTLIAALTSDSVILNQHACAQFSCLCGICLCHK